MSRLSFVLKKVGLSSNLSNKLFCYVPLQHYNYTLGIAVYVCMYTNYIHTDGWMDG